MLWSSGRNGLPSIWGIHPFPPKRLPIILENIFLLPGRIGVALMFLFNLVIFLCPYPCSFTQGATAILLLKILATTYQTISKLKQTPFLPLPCVLSFFLVSVVSVVDWKRFSVSAKITATAEAVYYNFYTAVPVLSLGYGN
jgi:hypothetical protein